MNDRGEQHEAGEGLTDEEMVREVTSQTSSDLKHEDFFEMESEGAATDVEAAKADAEDVTDTKD